MLFGRLHNRHPAPTGLSICVLAPLLLSACGGDGASGGPPAETDSGATDVAPLDSGDASVSVDAPGDADGIGEEVETTDVVDGAADVSDVDVEDGAAPCSDIGCACESDAECGGGLCIPAGPSGEGICSEYCDRTGECPSGYDCRLYVNSSGDAVSFCVPASQWCAPCSPANLLDDCGGLGYDCGAVDDGRFCMPEALDGRCAQGWRARLGDDGRTFCYPDSNVCSPCYDPDGDGYGVGVECAGADCNQSSTAAFSGATELCDGIDNDCDLNVDEGFDPASDVTNCGGCGIVCVADGAVSACVLGECVIASCEPGRADCDADATTGCETVLNDGCTSCDDLAREGEACGLCDEGTLVCAGDGTLECETASVATELNACGGCGELEGEPGASCGTCGFGTWECSSDGSAVECLNAVGEPLINACGGCAPLDAQPGDLCGTCQSGRYECEGADALRCVGDEGEAALNACGGCGELPADIGAPCGACGTGVYACAEGELYCDDTDSECRLSVWFRPAPFASRGRSASYRVATSGAAPSGLRGSSFSFTANPFSIE